jgi:hypothetical protein
MGWCKRGRRGMIAQLLWLFWLCVKKEGVAAM